MGTEQQGKELDCATINAKLDRIAMSGRDYYFKDPSFRTRFVQSLIIISITLLCVAVYSGILERQLLVDIQQGAFVSEEEATAAANINDFRQGIIGFGQTFLFIVTIIFFMMWVHRSNNNIRALTGKPLKFTPGWAVGWFFVPIAFLWKPYEAIKEIWQASADHCTTPSPSSQSLLGYWWSCWLLSTFLGNASFRLQMRAEELDQMILASSVTIASDVMDAVTYVLTFLMIGRIYSMQNLIKENLRPVEVNV